ncbi:zinc finger protein 488 isoform X1 [Chiloscyllium punctatum]|uniref:zinc finger protein 488 isoform X1 n=1 Tax=Chiloscyllium punctatum TaxID=137246 RepID=UPI003B633726
MRKDLIHQRSGCIMELTPFSKGLWAGDNKFLHHLFTDILTSVHITREIPEDAIFGPCLLQNTFYDTVAFIALKSSDRRSAPYVFRVDATAISSTTDGVSWLKLVQAANNTKEQNLEAYLKSGQLYYRSTRRINKDEELFVWYDSELSTLLGFTDIKTRADSNTFRCVDCDQELKYENPYLAHVRFLCGKRKEGLAWRDLQALGAAQTSLLKEPERIIEDRVTNFHRIAHDLEHSKRKPGAQDESRPSAASKRKQDGGEENKVRKTVLLEKTNHLASEQGEQLPKEGASVRPALAVSVWRLHSDKFMLKKDSAGHNTSAFTEVRRLRDKVRADKAEGNDKESDSELTRKVGLRTDVVLSSTGSAFSSVLPSSAREEQKSAFCQPHRRTALGPSMLVAHTLHSPSECSRDFPDSIPSNGLPGHTSLLGSKLLSAELGGSHILHTSVSTHSPFLYSTELWPKPVGVQLQSTSSLTLLPPSYTSFAVSAQNWCAKCNASFRMTSDLVFHMRSHHKKEYATDYLSQRRREDKLTCPICNEFFRERHHLSRHMTSHN